jgi:uncharacterized protein YecT (DUF1311 family)
MSASPRLKRDGLKPNRHRASAYFWRMISAQMLRICREGKPVPTPHRVRGRLFPNHALAALAVAAALLVPVAASASDDSDANAAFSSAPTLLHLCGGDDALIKGDACKDGSYAQTAAKLEAALQRALARAPANIRPLLKRDQYWFAETIQNAAENGLPQSEKAADREAFAGMLSQRLTTLEQIADGFDRPGVLGKWEDAFGSVTVTAADGGAYRLEIKTDSGFGADDDRRWRCQATALVAPAPDGWLEGAFTPEQGDGKSDSNDGKASPVKPLAIKLRRQGESLRIVSAEPDWQHNNAPPTCAVQQVTASYFASGKQDAAAATVDKIDAAFTTPTFDCARPDTASDEEICADPDLAEGDRRLNAAWKALLPRLDETTRRALLEDQRNWVRQQADLYPVSLHPGQDKMRYELHHTDAARIDLYKLQRERIALLEGFDENRKGLAGLWLGYTAIIKITVTNDGSLEAKGWKWEQGDWKAGCDYEMDGDVVNGVFRSSERRKNPDTLERDHATLIVNRLDDAFAKKRFGSSDADEMKCKRSPERSSTARLFPVRPSPDIDETGDWH